MPKHQPIRFKEPTISQDIKERINKFIEEHPRSYSTLKVLLGLILASGVLTISAIAPNAVGAMLRMTKDRDRIKRDRYNKLWQTFNRLKKEGAIRYCGSDNGEMIYELTERGKKKMRRFALDTLKINRPIKWDGRWRIIIFDIPERKGAARRAIQRKLNEMGFYQLQKSVWVHPFPCEAEIEFLKDFFDLKQFVYILYSEIMPSGKALYYFKEDLKPVV